MAALLGVAHGALVMTTTWGGPSQPPSGELVFACELSATAAWIVGVAHLAFDVVLIRLGILKPAIIRDLTILALVGIAAALGAARAGFALSGVIATSAVLTAIIGLSLQDTLGNIIGGVSLQMDQSLSVGDWIRIQDLKGRVVQIGWRCTTIETNDWETILIPNSVLMRGSVVILARRSGSAALWRRWVRFHAPISVPPATVIHLVQAALDAADIPHRAVDPSPTCICTGIDHGCASYAVRYWLTDPLHDDSTDSRTRSVVVAALARAGIPLATPIQNLNVHRTDPVVLGEEPPARLLANIPLFAGLTATELELLSRHLVAWPVATGERLMRAGEPGDCLYVVARGKFSVEITDPGGLRIHVARLGRGTIAGEMSVLTGAPRNATVTALTDSLCYRLGRSAFKTLTDQRPELLEEFSFLLSERQEGNEQAQRDVRDRRLAAQDIGQGSRILQRMRDWLQQSPTSDTTVRPAVEVAKATVIAMPSPDL